MIQRVQGLEGAPQRSDPSPRHELSWQRPQSGSPPTVRDPRLMNVDIRSWSSVAIPNDLAGRLIGFYLEMDHAVLGHFDADLFVEDLTQFRTEFCSSLLVNSLLLWACVSSPNALPLLHITDKMNSMGTRLSTSVL